MERNLYTKSINWQQNLVTKKLFIGEFYIQNNILKLFNKMIKQEIMPVILFQIKGYI